MKRDELIKLFIVDDDPLFLKLLEMEFEQTGMFQIQTYATGELCLLNLSKFPDVIILDYHLNGIVKDAINGIDTLKVIKDYILDIPVIMLSSQDKIEVAVNCMHNGAFDYIVKSETAFLRLQKAITENLSYNKMKKELSWYMDRM